MKSITATSISLTHNDLTCKYILSCNVCNTVLMFPLTGLIHECGQLLNIHFENQPVRLVD